MRCFKIESIEYGWFDFRIGTLYRGVSDYLGYDMPVEFLSKLLKILRSSSKEWVYLMYEPGAEIMEFLRSDNTIIINVYSINKLSYDLSRDIADELQNIGNCEFSIRINIPEIVDAVVAEYSLFENGNGRKCHDMNWGRFPQKEYDELKIIAFEMNKDQDEYDSLYCVEFLKN